MKAKAMAKARASGESASAQEAGVGLWKYHSLPNRLSEEACTNRVLGKLGWNAHGEQTSSLLQAIKHSTFTI
jgi:hypothetical protein